MRIEYLLIRNFKSIKELEIKDIEDNNRDKTGYYR